MLETRRVRSGRQTLASAVFAVLLSACSADGQTSASSLPAPGTPAQIAAEPVASSTAISSAGSSAAAPVPVPVKLTYVFGVNGIKTQTAVKRRVAQSATYIGYTSTALPVSITLSVTPLGGSVSTYSGSCAAAASGSSGTCAVAFTAVPGPTTLAGTLTEAGNTIAGFSQMQIIGPGSASTINFTANPVVSSASLQPAAPSVTAGSPSDTLLTLVAQDANGNTIVGNQPYVDSSGQPVAFSLSVTNSQSGGHGTVNIKGPSRIDAPGQAATYAHYDGNWLDHATINLISNSNIVTSLTGTTVTTSVAHSTYTPGLSSYTVTLGPDGDIWYDGSTSGCVGKITQNGQYNNFCTAMPPGAYPLGITSGPDGNMWYIERVGNKIGRISLDGTTVTEFSGPTALPIAICAGPDGNIWFNETSQSNIYRMRIDGSSVTAFPGMTGVPTGRLSGIAPGPGDTIWVTETSPAQIGRMSTTGTQVMEFSTGLPASATLGGIIEGPDGNMWFYDNGPTPSAVGRITPSGTIMEFPLTLGGSLRAITVGADGNIWVSEATSRIARVTTSGFVTEFADPSYGLTASPDGNLWSTDGGPSTRVTKFIL